MIAAKHIEIMALVLASILALYVGSHIVLVSVPMLSVVGAFFFTVIWAMVAAEYWWVPVISGALILGVFRIGFKVYPIEVALMLAVIGLVPLILIKNRAIFQSQRRPLPFIFYLTAGYVLVRLGIDILPVHGMERNNLARVLFGAIWPFIFVFMFHHYGNLSVTRTAIRTAFVLLLIRTTASAIGYLTSIPLVIPGINYVLSFSDADSLTAMRYVAFMLFIVTAIFYHSTKSQLPKIFYVGIMGACVLLVIMGASRFSTLLMFILPVFFFAWTRHWALLFVAALVGFGIVATINIFPHSIDPLPPVAQRSLSGLMIGDAAGYHEATGSSDLWHEDLRIEGYHRWTESPLTLMFGYGIRPSPDLYATLAYSVDPKTALEVAANVGSYECGLWTLLALFGVVGFVLHLLLFLYFWKRTLPYFFRRPVGTFWEGILFWGCYTSMMYFAVCYFQGGFPSLELVMLIIAADAVEEGKLGSRNPIAALVSNPKPLAPQLARSPVS